MRNPWGSFEWSGDWSDDSDCWTPELKALVGFTDEPDGTFWMSYTDFQTYFSRVQVCKIRDNYEYSYFPAGHKPGSFALVRFVVENDGDCTISVAQKDKRCFSRRSGYDYSNCRLIVMKIDVEKTDLDEDGDTFEVDYVDGT